MNRSVVKKGDALKTLGGVTRLAGRIRGCGSDAFRQVNPPPPFDHVRNRTENTTAHASIPLHLLEVERREWSTGHDWIIGSY